MFPTMAVAFTTIMPSTFPHKKAKDKHAGRAGIIELDTMIYFV